MEGRIPKLLRRLTAATSLVLIGGVCTAEALGLGYAGFGATDQTLLAFGATFGGLSLLGLRMRPQLILTGCCLIYPLLLMAVFMAWSPAYLTYTIHAWIWGRPPVPIYHKDPVLGHAHIPGARAVHQHFEFSPTYSIDATGWRCTPSPTDPAGEVWLLGCSFTFGDGVADEECYPYRLGAEHWTDLKIRNLATSGWGTEQAYVTLKQRLAQGPKPRFVLYGWITCHASRAQDMHTWLVDEPDPIGFLAKREKEPPPAAPALDAPLARIARVGQRGFTLAAALIREMHALCETANIPFGVVLFSENQYRPGMNPALLAFLEAENIPAIDLREVGRGHFYRRDGHPTKKWHDAVATALAQHPRIQAWIAGHQPVTASEGM